MNLSFQQSPTMAVNKQSMVAKSTVSKNERTVAEKTLVKHVRLNMKKEIRQRDQVCQFKDTRTGRLCGAKHFLEIDHIEPRYQGGNNEKENLRILCKNHNIFRYLSNL